MTREQFENLKKGDIARSVYARRPCEIVGPILPKMSRKKPRVEAYLINYGPYVGELDWPTAQHYDVIGPNSD
jgi:hypothetical protein